LIGLVSREMLRKTLRNYSTLLVRQIKSRSPLTKDSTFEDVAFDNFSKWLSGRPIEKMLSWKKVERIGDIGIPGRRDMKTSR
jgi:hypothetical protein